LHCFFDRLWQCGAAWIFGITGDFVLPPYGAQFYRCRKVEAHRSSSKLSTAYLIRILRRQDHRMFSFLGEGWSLELEADLFMAPDY
jgi:hypothetical protein